MLYPITFSKGIKAFLPFYLIPEWIQWADSTSRTIRLHGFHQGEALFIYVTNKTNRVICHCIHHFNWCPDLSSKNTLTYSLLRWILPKKLLYWYHYEVFMKGNRNPMKKWNPLLAQRLVIKLCTEGGT